jgi:DNA-binding MarR family transcriptional regulator
MVNEMSGAATTVRSDPLTVANRLRPVLLQLARELRREVHPLGITGGQVALLSALRRHPGAGVRELAAREGVSAAAMSRHVDRLVRAGLVERTEDAGGDRRRVGLELTAEAERVLRQVRSRRTAWLVARLRELDDDELESVNEAIEPLQALLEAGS